MANEKRLIDVNKVIASMQKCLDEAPDKKDSVAYVTFEALIECLKQEPTVDAVEVVHGRWERMVGMMPPEYHGRHECSCCGVKALDWKFHEYLSNYCPNCGAKMDGGVKNA